MNEDLICPYCEAVQETHEPDQISADMCWTECESCGQYLPLYRSMKDWLNSEVEK